MQMMCKHVRVCQRVYVPSEPCVPKQQSKSTPSTPRRKEAPRGSTPNSPLPLPASSHLSPQTPTSARTCIGHVYDNYPPRPATNQPTASQPTRTE
ncbi:hypothetical protein E2C01_093004 [Portunus trituberculatus]|uniref:Uncharacterized protein n=1 Tax=Portunus trituberculatus TaxID=210409 RepID=A0A5B7JS70_PORTR|nr:hypothetical protein [Portunus trituberculatus]